MLTSTTDAVDGQPAAAGPDVPDTDPVGLSAVAQVDGAAALGTCLGAPAARERVEARAVGGRLGVGELDRRLEERGVRGGHPRRLAREP